MRSAALLACLVGCTHSAPPAESEPADARGAEALRSYVTETAHRDQPLPALGTACRSEPTCGTAQRVALHVEVDSRSSEPPCTMLDLHEPASGPMMDLLEGCMSRDRVYFVAWCNQCRIRSNKSVQATFAELTSAQRQYLRGWLQLPAGTKLESRADWQRVLTPRTP